MCSGGVVPAFTRATTAYGLMGGVPAPMSVSLPHRTSLVVSLALPSLEPGPSLAAAVRLADALDARRVPLTLLAGPRPHPDVLAWASARRRAGDAVLLHGTGGEGGRGGQPTHRLPAHEAGLRLAAALRARDAGGLAVDGFAAPGWAVSSGVRGALSAAGIDLLVDGAGVHRLDGDGTPRSSVLGGVVVPGSAPRVRTRAWRRMPSSLLPTPRTAAGARAALRHLGATAGTTRVEDLLDAVDRDLDAGAVPHTAPGLLSARRPPRSPRELGDPEHWSITA